MKIKTIDKLLELVNSISSFYEKCKVKDGNQYDFKIAETAIEMNNILKEEKERKSREKMFLPKNTKIYLKETERLLNPEKKPLDLILDGVELIEEIKELKQGAMRKENDNLREEIKTYQHLTKLLSDENEQLKKDSDYLLNADFKIFPSIPDQRFSIKQVNEIINKIKASGVCQIMVDNALKSIKDKDININVNSKELRELREINKALNSINLALHKRLDLLSDDYDKLKTEKSKKKIDIFNPSNWFIKDEDMEDKIKEAKNKYDRLVNETPIKRLSIDQIRDYVNKKYFGKF